MKKIFHSLTFVAALFGVLAAQGCQENEFGTVDLSKYQPDTTNVGSLTYAHPMALYTASDFQRVKTALADGTAAAPVQEEFLALKNSPYASLSYTATPQTIIRRGTEYIDNAHRDQGTLEQTYTYAMRDAAAAYQLGLLWQLTGDTQYAAKGVEVLNAWAKTCTGISTGASDNVLTAGAQGFTFALAAEELRDYSGWTESDFTAFKNWMTDVFATVNYKFLQVHNGVTCGAKHYWSNWDMVSLCSYFQIGILTENDEMIKYVIEYFTSSGIGNGCLSNLALGDLTDPLGSGEKLCQNQESGRDQGHAQMSTAVAIQLCQAAWSLYQSNPATTSLDFYAANDNAVLKMAEYVALTNLRSGTDNANKDGNWLLEASRIPFATVGPWCTGGDNHEAAHTHTVFSQTQRGDLRPNWEMLYQHYRAQGITTTAYAKQAADKLRPECGAGDSRYGSNSGAFDQIGWSTLMTYTE